MDWHPQKKPLSVLQKIGIGMCLGLLGPFVLPLLAGSLPIYSKEQVRLLVTFGPVFGGAMAYFLHRYRRLEERVGSYWWTVFAGALAGGATASVAYDFGYLTELWHVGAGFAVGGVFIALVQHM